LKFSWEFDRVRAVDEALRATFNKRMPRADHYRLARLRGDGARGPVGHA
jgi:hypothetical protein